MKTSNLRSLTLLAAASALLAGCATHLKGATQVGGEAPATWVFVRADGDDEQGIFRCREVESGPVCTKARIEQAR